jgi:hypothetical protein
MFLCNGLTFRCTTHMSHRVGGRWTGPRAKDSTSGCRGVLQDRLGDLFFGRGRLRA